MACGLIIGGQNATKGRFPNTAILLSADPERRYICTASLIAPDMVLSGKVTFSRFDSQFDERTVDISHNSSVLVSSLLATNLTGSCSLF